MNSTKTKSALQFFIASLLLLTSCDNNTAVKTERNVDKKKRDELVKRYDLLRFQDLQKPILLTIDEFFDGNNDVASIAPNLNSKPAIAEYYRIFKTLSENPKTAGHLLK